MDILEKLGVDFNTGSLDSSLDWYVHDYVNKKAAFHEKMHALREAYRVKEEPVIAKKFVHPNEFFGLQEILNFYTEIKNYIDEMECDDWAFSNIENVQENFNFDPYEDYEDMRTVIYVHAYIKSDNQPTTHEQELAMSLFKNTRFDFEKSKEALERQIKEIKR